MACSMATVHLHGVAPSTPDVDLLNHDKVVHEMAVAPDRLLDALLGPDLEEIDKPFVSWLNLVL